MFADDIFDDEDDPKPPAKVEGRELAHAEGRKGQASDDFTRLKTAVEAANISESDMIELLNANPTFIKLFVKPLDDMLEQMVILTMNSDVIAKPEEIKSYILAYRKLFRFRASIRLHREHGEKVLNRAIQALLR